MSAQMSLLAIVIVGLTVFSPTVYRDLDARDPSAPQTPSDVARLQIDRGAVVELPAKGKVKLSLKENAPTFLMPGGMSSVVLLRLPEYRAPYDLRIVSSQVGVGRTTEIFVPSGVYFDDEFQELARWGEERLVREGWRVTMAVTFGEPGRNMRYLLLYTRGEWLGLHIRLDARGSIYGVPVPGKIGLLLGNPSGFLRLKRSLHGKIEVETKPKS